ncbi:D-alanyl-D-alanine carboxypeptidase family protein [Mesobacterium sp. TK19101]|uniref:D-alanyl-D-alanine carboxypeptidase family protein n=1 Tax=Mesobacterium hydrothermale TaxID=3111907 RepID=A0ABU6HLT4_9RHOB|nr:D-alanyl-D-alanine carboxypeptidase family protein [Mesobacterium sp. TK19101]MEC3863321.1 D-alanyl-D-alanine carboxypeptidase family protein [Mesobacterium sp. TK19101]
MIVFLPLSVAAAPYAALVMDARSGEVLYTNNADTRLHPASLTKMMTLYIAFQAVENGEITMDTLVRVSSNAANEPPSKLGLRAGQKIALRYLVRAAAVKSANDAATAIGEAIEGSEAAFARRMNRTAKAMGMTRTTFKNAHGLTEAGHLSTARDMSILGRHLIYDYPQYYNLFKRKTADAGVRTVSHTNTRFLESYPGADGIKTGYTRAAGFNLVASAERGKERIIATVFGGRSTASRNAKVKELLDLGFRRAPSNVALHKPDKPGVARSKPEVERLTTANPNPDGRQGKSIRVASAAVKRSLRPKARPGSTAPPPLLVADAVKDDIDDLVKQAQAVDVPPEVVASEIAPEDSPLPRMRPESLFLASTGDEATAPRPEREVVTRLSTSGGRHWGINVGRFPTRFHAEKALLKTALLELETLDGTLRKVVGRNSGFDANFMGLTRETADLACRRLQARQVQCFMIGPG